MKKLLLMLAILLLTVTPAWGELAPGSQGDEVKSMQGMLFDLGFLSSAADGLYGPETEQAVKDWQAYNGYGATGIMDDESLHSLMYTWEAVNDLFAEAEEAELRQDQAAACVPMENEQGLHYTYCSRHARQEKAVALLSAGAPNAKLEKLLCQRLSELWLDDIRAIYDAWEEKLPQEDKHIAREQREGFEDALKAQSAQWEAETEDGRAAREKALWLDEAGVNLCFEYYGIQEGNF